MNPTIVMLCVFLVSILVHEVGHYLAFWMNGIKHPVIKLHWWGISVGSQEQMEGLTLRESIDVYSAGIVLGYCVIYLGMTMLNITNTTLVFAYLVACFIDFSNLYQIVIILQKNPELKNLRFDRAQERLAKEIILSMKQKD